jgi:hypothetical protein
MASQARNSSSSRLVSCRWVFLPSITGRWPLADRAALAHNSFKDHSRESNAVSATTEVNRGDGLLMSGSLASRTAAMIDAAITSVEANRSVIRLCSAIALVRSCSSLAMARLISPTYHRRSVSREGFASRSCESRPWKMSFGRYRRLAPQSGQSAIIQESGMVPIGAGMFW